MHAALALPLCRFVGLNAGLIFVYYTQVLCVDEEEFRGPRRHCAGGIPAVLCALPGKHAGWPQHPLGELCLALGCVRGILGDYFFTLKEALPFARSLQVHPWAPGSRQLEMGYLVTGSTVVLYALE